MELLKILGLLQKQNPQQRFGQIISNLLPSHFQRDCFHIADADLLKSALSALHALRDPALPRCVILVGLPGSSKSTTAREWVQGKEAVICSTDDFFMKEGVYCFDPRKLTENHAANYRKFALACARRTPVVVVDNTNLIAAHRAPYIELAGALGYQVEVQVVGGFSAEEIAVYAARNTHGVPLASIQRMAATVELPE